MGRIFVVFSLIFLVLSILPSTYQRNLSPKRQLQQQQQQQQQQQDQEQLQGQGFFDPHNHYDGIFPWEAYVNLSAYANNEPFTYQQALNLYLWLNESFYPTGETIPVYNTDSRTASGCSATFLLFQNLTEFEETPSLLYGALERVLSTTPFTEFDSGYNLRAMIVDSDDPDCYSTKYIYDGNVSQLSSDECSATLMELTNTNITTSEQIIVLFNNIWSNRNQCILRCLASNPGRGHKLLLMALGNRLAYSDSENYQSWNNPTGECQATAWTNTGPSTVNLTEEADDLIGSFRTYLEGGTGECQEALAAMEEMEIWDTLVGVDHAGPELTCYTPQGMEYFKQISLNMMNEVKWRDSQGNWDGRPLLHHVHVGEGFSLYYTNEEIEVATATFSSVFGQLPGYGPVPNFRTNTEVPRNNIALIMEAIDELVQGNNDIYGSVIFRLGHVSHMDAQTADLLADIHKRYPGLVEADINMDSNLITHAYEIVGVDVNAALQETLANRTTNFEADHLSQYFVPDPTDVEQVGLILGNFTALKFLLTSGVPVLLPIILGTDGTGDEHSPMSRQHDLAASLISYWSEIDPEFAALDVQVTYFNESSNYHLQTMATTHHEALGIDWIIGILTVVGILFVLLVAGLVVYWKKSQEQIEEYIVVNE